MRLLVLGAAALLVGACSAITSFDDFVGPGLDAGDGSSSGSSGSSGSADASVDASADAEAGGTPVTVSESDFESGSTCSGWSVSNGTATIVAVGHGGARSCKLCVTSSTSKPNLEREFAKPEAGVWKISAWGTARADDDVGPNKWKVRIGSADQEGQLTTSSWSQLEEQTTIGAGMNELKARITLESETVGHCMLVDDIVITRTP